LKKKIYKVVVIGLGRAGAIFNIKENKFISLKENLENLENLENFKNNY
jgi:hypothetical protein